MSRQGVCLVASLSAVVGMGAQPPAADSLGRWVPPAVKMTGECSGFVLASGKLEAALHEIDGGSANIGRLTLAMPVDSVALVRVKELLDSDVELVLRRRLCREQVGR